MGAIFSIQHRLHYTPLHFNGLIVQLHKLLVAFLPLPKQPTTEHTPLTGPLLPTLRPSMTDQSEKTPVAPDLFFMLQGIYYLVNYYLSWLRIVGFV